MYVDSMVAEILENALQSPRLHELNRGITITVLNVDYAVADGSCDRTTTFNISVIYISKSIKISIKANKLIIFYPFILLYPEIFVNLHMNLVLIKNLILINMWSIRILTFIYVCFLSIKATAQEIPNDIPSPTVASLAKFGDIPVSMFTGTPKITIPIFELKSLEKSMPISLDYDASGFQINALPSCTGHNWTLQAGGVITRQRVGN